MPKPAVYSHSRLEAFEQCPLKYRYRYIDGIKTDREGIEAFMGKRVHETLEKLHKDLKLTKLNSLDELLRFYDDAWLKNWNDRVEIARTRSAFTPDHYQALGRKCVTNYYQAWHPFDQSTTIGLEERLTIRIERPGRVFELQGYVDRLTLKNGVYGIHDYKTGSSLPSQQDVDEDRQLALYQVGLEQRWPDARDVRLIWHYLAFGKTLTSSRDPEGLRAVQEDVVQLITAIEAAEDFPPQKSPLCDWCDYRSICPLWKHAFQAEALPPNEYLHEPGVQLVQRYAELEDKKTALKEETQAITREQDRIAEAAVALGEQGGFSVLDGPRHQLRIETKEELKAPKKAASPIEWRKLRETLQRAGRLEEVSTVNDRMLERALRVNDWPEAFKREVSQYLSRVRERVVSLVRKKVE